jgi:hypothetical protein
LPAWGFLIVFADQLFNGFAGLQTGRLFALDRVDDVLICVASAFKAILSICFFVIPGLNLAAGMGFSL